MTMTHLLRLMLPEIPISTMIIQIVSISPSQFQIIKLQIIEFLVALPYPFVTWSGQNGFGCSNLISDIGKNYFLKLSSISKI